MRWDKKMSVISNPANQLNGIDFRDQMQQEQNDDVRIIALDEMSVSNSIKATDFRD